MLPKFPNFVPKPSEPSLQHKLMGALKTQIGHVACLAARFARALRLVVLEGHTIRY